MTDDEIFELLVEIVWLFYMKNTRLDFDIKVQSN